MDIAFFLAFLAGGPASAGQTSAPVPEADLPTLVRGNTGFAIDLFEMLRDGDPDGNLFFSPYSISAALGMTYAGARGGTGEQMAAVLQFTLPPERLHQAFALLGERLGAEYRARLSSSGTEGLLTLEVANALWVQQSFRILDSYRRIVEARYHAEARSVDFEMDPEGSRQLINDWVAERTADRIMDLLAPGTIDDQTRVVITNAIYFKGSWMSQFDQHLTRDGEFTTPGGSTVTVPMMRQTRWYPCAMTEGCTAISLPYSDGLSSMLVLLPDGDLGQFERDLDPEVLERIAGRLQSTDVDLSMPRFEFTRAFSLHDVLKDMGMPDAFDSSADFSGITGQRDLFISDVIHKAFVKVDETGTEAAAATAVVMALGCASPTRPVRVVLDRPFLFLIRDEVTGSILFMGRVADPTE